MRTKERIELSRGTKELYLERFEMMLDEAISENGTKQNSEWKLFEDPKGTEFTKNLHRETIEALKVEETALRQIRDTIKVKLAKVRKY